MIVSDNVIQAECLGDFFKNLGKKGLNVSKKMAKNVLSNPGQALDLTAKIATAAASRNSKQALSALPELITFYNTGKGLFLENFFEHSLIYSNNNYNYTYKSTFCNLYYINGAKKQKDYIPQHHLKTLIWRGG